MISNITLTSSMRSNLSSLKSLASQMSTTQTRLSTGKKVNSAIDNANSYYQSRALTNRASDLDMLLDAMGQSIQTVATATRGIESGLSLIEQMSSIAGDAMINFPEGVKYYAKEFVNIDASMSTAEIQNIINNNSAIALTEDITLTSSLDIGSDVTIIGNGHTITYAATHGSQIDANGEFIQGDNLFNISGNAKISNLKINYSNTAAQGVAIAIDGGKAEIDNLTIDGSTTANRLYGIQVLNKGKLTLDTTKNINLSGDYCQKLVNGNPDLWAGRYNTDMIINALGRYALPTAACDDYETEGLGSGEWYQPSLGELCDLLGTDYNLIDDAPGDSGYIGDVKDKVNQTLSVLLENGVVTDAIYSYYWSSSPEDSRFWEVNSSGGRSDYYRNEKLYVRPIADVAINKDTSIGDIMYADFTTGKMEDYNSNKTAIGVVFWVSEDKSTAKIVSLQNLPKTIFASTDRHVDEIQGYYWNRKNPTIPYALAALTAQGEIEVTNSSTDKLSTEFMQQQEQFNTALGAYDELVKDASYQGVNLLEGNSLRVMFNETRTHSYTVQGQKADMASLGVDASNWETLSDVQTSIAQLNVAVATLRNIAEAFGNSLRIIETRMDFTDAMTDVLQTGADDLVLADMNEESANYLALQTRNSLAVNALALAAQSNNSVLNLF